MAIVKSMLPGSHRYYGWKPQLPDRRDLRFSPPPRVMESLPPSVDLRPKMGPVLDQGPLGSCGPNAVDSLILFDQQKEAQPVRSVSRLAIYYNARFLMNTLNEDSGVDNRTMLKSLAQFGFCDEELWPYNVGRFREAPPANAVQTASRALITDYAAVAQDLDVMKGCLAAGYPFLFGFTVYESFESLQVAETGDVPMPGAGERVVGGHDVVICGYDDSQQDFLLKNSWGAWGIQQSGYGRMPYAYATDSNLATDFWVINAIPTGAPTPPPGPTPAPTPLTVVFNLAFSRQVPRGGRIIFAAPVTIPAGKYDVVVHQTPSEPSPPQEGAEYKVEATEVKKLDPQGWTE